MALDTGLGAVLTAVPGSWTGNTVRIDLGAHSLPMVDTSHLGTTTFRTIMAGDLIDPGTVTLEVQFEGDTALPAPGDSGTLTVTDPLASGETTAANWSGTAIVSEVRHGVREIDGLKTAEIDVRWDGGTGPTFSAAT